MAGLNEPQPEKKLASGAQSSMAGWFAELKRRRVFRAVVAYGVAAFAVLQVIEPIMHGLHWPESVLSYVVAALAAGFPAVIGLAWVFDVKRGRIERTPSSGTPPGRRGVLALLLVGIALLAAAPGLFYYFMLRSAERGLPNAPHSSGTATKIHSVVVLPFVNASQNADAEYLADGITEGLINRLSEIRELQIIARTTAFHYKGQQVDFQRAARELSVDAALTGTLRQVGNTLVIQADLMNLATGTELWGDRYNRKLTDVLLVQEEITQAILEKIRLRLTTEEQQRVNKRYSENTEAYQLYLRGRYFWNKRGKENITKAIDYFEKAVELEPSFALAHAGLADSYALLGGEYGGMTDGLAKADAAARRALALDDGLAETHASLGIIASSRWDWLNAEREYKRAIALNPNYATAHHWYANYLRDLGRWQEALAEIKVAHQLDPLSLPITFVYGMILYETGSYDRAIALYKDWLVTNPDHALAKVWLANCYVKKNMYDEAISIVQEARALIEKSPDLKLSIARIYAQTGNKAEALKILEHVRGGANDAGLMASVYAALHDKDRAFEWLEKGYQQHSNSITLLRSSLYEPLRADPRYADLERRLGFPE